MKENKPGLLLLLEEGKKGEEGEEEKEEEEEEEEEKEEKEEGTGWNRLPDSRVEGDDL